MPTHSYVMFSLSAGKDVVNECKNHIADTGRMLPGQVFVSKPGHLSCKCIIHAIVPIWKDGSKNETMHLYEALFASLMAAHNKSLTSIALPFISGGIFRFPREIARDIIL